MRAHPRWEDDGHNEEEDGCRGESPTNTPNHCAKQHCQREREETVGNEIPASDPKRIGLKEIVTTDFAIPPRQHDGGGYKNERHDCRPDARLRGEPTAT